MKNKLNYSANAVAAYILGAVSAAFSVFFIVKDVASTSAIITGIIDLAIIFVAMGYFFHGSGKTESIRYRLYFLLNAAAYPLSYLIALLIGDYMQDGEFVVSLFFGMLCYGNYLCIALAKDLGKKVTIGMISCNIILYIIYSAILLIDAVKENQFDSMMFLQYLSYVPSCAIDLIIAKAKYHDKSIRASQETTQ